tara:strand:+ start:182 stop:787 length:606 start_codon:yes stop_codon:yes gene_type:complete
MSTATITRLANHLDQVPTDILKKDRHEPLATCRKAIMAYMSNTYKLVNLPEAFNRSREVIRLAYTEHDDNYEVYKLYRQCYDKLVEMEGNRGVTNQTETHQGEKFFTYGMKTEELITERGSKYGEFTDNASVSQQLKYVLRQQDGWINLLGIQQEAIDMTFVKMARMTNGDSTYVDNVDDILGYWQLVKERMEKPLTRTKL